MNWKPIKTAPTPGDHSGMFLVTNNLTARNAFGVISHVWLVNMVHPTTTGTFTAFAHPGFQSVQNLTHWMPIEGVTPPTP